jgi:hypothetical protein
VYIVGIDDVSSSSSLLSIPKQFPLDPDTGRPLRDQVDLEGGESLLKGTKAAFEEMMAACLGMTAMALLISSAFLHEFAHLRLMILAVSWLPHFYCI